MEWGAQSSYLRGAGADFGRQPLLATHNLQSSCSPARRWSIPRPLTATSIRAVDGDRPAPHENRLALPDRVGGPESCCGGDRTVVAAQNHACRSPTGRHPSHRPALNGSRRVPAFSSRAAGRAHPRRARIYYHATPSVSALAYPGPEAHLDLSGPRRAPFSQRLEDIFAGVRRGTYPTGAYDQAAVFYRWGRGNEPPGPKPPHRVPAWRRQCFALQASHANAPAFAGYVTRRFFGCAWGCITYRR